MKAQRYCDPLSSIMQFGKKTYKREYGYNYFNNKNLKNDKEKTDVNSI